MLFGTFCECAALYNFKIQLTLPLAAMVPAVRSVVISAVGNLSRILDFSAERPEELDSWPYSVNVSSMSEAPIFEPVPRVLRSVLNALAIVVSAEA